MPTPEEIMSPYRHHGLDLVWRPGAKEAVADCPFCGKERHFSLCVQGEKAERWRCLLCSEGSDKGGGNASTFCQKLWEHGRKNTAGQDYLALSSERKLWSPKSLVTWGVVRSVLTNEWLIPGYNGEQTLCQVYAYRRDPKGGKNQWRATAGMPQHVFLPQPMPKKYDTVYVCEGPWDGMALMEMLQGHPEIKGGWAVIAVPGLGCVGEPLLRWSKLYEGRKVVLLFDNDHPSEIKTPNQPPRRGAPAAFEATKKAVALLRGAGFPDGMYLSWGEGGYDEKLPHGYDVRDLLTRG